MKKIPKKYYLLFLPILVTIFLYFKSYSATKKLIQNEQNLSHFIQKKFVKNSAENLITQSTHLEERRLLKDEYFSSEKLAIICKFKQLGLAIPHSGKVQVLPFKFSSPYKITNSILIKSPECPEDYFSLIYFNDEGKVLRELNCLDTNLTELMKFSGEQGNIKQVKNPNESFNISFASGGYFVLQCPDKTLLITRDGRYKKDNFGHMINNDKCTLLNQEARPFTGSNVLDIAVYDPGRDEIVGLTYLNSYSFKASSGIHPSKSIVRIGPKEFRPYIHTDSYEILDDPNRGPTGIHWKDVPKIDLDEIDCN